MDYIDKNLSFPKDEKLDNEILIIYVEFEIDLDGKIISAKAKNALNYKSFVREAERVVKSAPNWEQKEGHKIPNYKMSVPVVFRR